MQGIKDTRSKRIDSKKIEDGKLERIFEQRGGGVNEARFHRKDSGREGVRQRYVESILVAETKEIGNRYLSRNKDRN